MCRPRLWLPPLHCPAPDQQLLIAPKHEETLGGIIVHLYAQDLEDCVIYGRSSCEVRVAVPAATIISIGFNVLTI